MELTYDWRGFQATFSPKRRLTLQEAGEPTGPVYLIAEQDAVITAFANSEDLSDWVGAKVADVAVEFNHRELVVFERAEVDALMGEAAGLAHSYEQADFLLSNATATLYSKGHARKAQKGKLGSALPAVPRHFLLEALLGSGWWSKVLPSAYGIFIRLEGGTVSPKDFFVVVRRGRLDTFCEPDFSSQPADPVKYLSEKYLVPVQGICVPAAEWKEWAESSHPWRKIALSIRANRAKLTPFRWGLVSLVATRGFLEI